MNPEAAAARWFEGFSLSPLGSGHIHDTFELRTGPSRFVLQRINESVFTDGDLLMAQTRRLLDCWQQQDEFVVPQLVQSQRGADSERFDDGLWRVWSFIEQSSVVDPVTSLTQAAQAGRAFGRFQRGLQKLQGPQFADTIAGFMQLDYYLSEYDAVAAAAPRQERRVIERHRGLADALGQRNSYIHADCKVNNLLFDEAAAQVKAIIDFDTVMFGHWAWDLGDLVRSVCFSAGSADVAYFAACLEGFCEARPDVTVHESVVAPEYVALMLGVRFLTDHLCGDRYFKVSRPGQNLRRAQEQIALFQEFLRLRPQYEEAAREIIEG